jgi:hypothetical protein
MPREFTLEPWKLNSTKFNTLHNKQASAPLAHAEEILLRSREQQCRKHGILRNEGITRAIEMLHLSIRRDVYVVMPLH